MDLERMNRRIKRTWKTFFILFFTFGIVFGLVFFVIDLKEKRYQEEYESTTWHEVEAVLTSSRSYEETERDADDEYITKTYYDWIYTYQGRDGKSYKYTDKRHYSEGIIGHTITIYVDEKDDSHHLPIRDPIDTGKFIWMMIGFVFVPYIVFFGIILTALYVGRNKANKTDE